MTSKEAYSLSCVEVYFIGRCVPKEAGILQSPHTHHGVCVSLTLFKVHSGGHDIIVFLSNKELKNSTIPRSGEFHTIVAVVLGLGNKESLVKNRTWIILKL